MRDKHKAKSQLLEELKRLHGLVDELEDATRKVHTVQEYARNILDSSLDMVIAVDKNRRITEFNRAAEKTFGYRREEVIGKHVNLLYADAKEGEKIYKTTLKRKENLREVINRRKDGELFQSLLSASILVDSHGKRVGLMGISRDITQQKQAEDRMREMLETEKQSVKQWQATFDAATDTIALISPEYEILKVNRAGYIALGKKPERLLGKKCYEVVHGLDAPIEGCPCVETLKTKKAASGDFTERGRQYLTTASPILDEDGQMTAFVYTVKDITLLKKVEEALRESEEKYRTMVELAPDGIIALDGRGFITSCNQSFLDMVGYSEDEYVDKHFSKLTSIRPKDLPRYVRLFRSVKKGETPRPFQTEVIKKDGTSVWFEVRVRLLKKEKKVSRILAIVRDISDRKRTDERLKAYNRQLEALNEASHMLVSTLDFKVVVKKCATIARELLDADGVVIYLLNQEKTGLDPIVADAPHAKQIMSTPLGLGEGVSGEVAVSGKAEIVNRIDRTDRGKQIPGTPVEPESLLSAPLAIKKKVMGTMTLNRLGDREFFDDDLTLLNNLANICAAAIGNAGLYDQAQKEISERNQIQQALRESEALFRGIFAAMQNGFYRLSENDVLLMANPALAHMLGYDSENDLIGKNIFDLGFIDEESRQKIKQDVLEKGEVTLVESEWTTSRGSVITVLENVRAVQKNGKLDYYEGTVQDVTQLKELENHLIQTQKMEVIGTLGGRIAHEINNRLTSVLGYADLCLLKLKEDDKLYKYMKSIQDNTRNAAGVTRQLLNFSRKQTSKPKDFDPDGLIKSLTEIVENAMGRRIDVQMQLNAQKAKIHADPALVEQAIMNLILNARDAMPDGGRLSIQTSRQKADGQARFGASIPPGHYVLLEVSDSGVGMSAKIREKIFEPFFTTKEASVATGLGLSIVQRVVQENGGFICVTSEERKGATFQLLFPEVGGMAEPTQKSD